MNIPNQITTFRMVMVGVIVLLLTVPAGLGFGEPIVYLGSTQVGLYRFICFFLFLLASISDFFDGYIARKYNLVTTYGKFMDPIADKLLVDSLIIIFVLPLSNPNMGFTGQTGIPMVCAVLMISRDLVVDVLRMLAMEKKVVIAASWFGKIKTVTQMVALSFVLLNNWPFSLLGWSVNVTNILCGIATVASLVSGIDYIIKCRSMFKDNKEETVNE